jgi:CheY-like chemotaxis protein
VVVRIEPAGDELLVHLANDRPEEDPDFASNAFLPFEPLTEPGDGYPDTGLALALAKRLADATGAALYASVEAGVGTTLSLRMPASQDPLVRLRPAGEGHEENGRAGTILYIEDNPSNIALIERMLGRFPGVRLLGTGLGKLGVDLARTHVPALVLLDINLPDISGHEVLGLLKAEPSTEAIPVIVLSAHDTPSRVKRAKDEGALDYFPKPIDVARLLEVIDGLLRRADHQG